MVPGKKMDTNEGIRLLTGNPKLDVPLKKPAAPAAPAAEEPLPAPVAARAATPFTTRCTVQENGSTRTFVITLEPQSGGGTAVATAPVASAPPVAAPTGGTPVFSTFATLA